MGHFGTNHSYFETLPWVLCPRNLIVPYFSEIEIKKQYPLMRIVSFRFTMIERIEISAVAHAMQDIHQTMFRHLAAGDIRIYHSTRCTAHPLHHRRNPKFTEAIASSPPIADSIIEHMLEMPVQTVIDFLSSWQKASAKERQRSHHHLTDGYATIPVIHGQLPINGICPTIPTTEHIDILANKPPCYFDNLYFGGGKLLRDANVLCHTP